MSPVSELAAALHMRRTSCIEVLKLHLSPDREAQRDVEWQSARWNDLRHRARSNRRNPPDAILREVYERTGDKPFGSIDEVISVEELKALTERYKRVAGYEKAALCP